MHRILRFSVLALSLLAFSKPAVALVEARVSYGLLATTADLGPLCPTCTADAPAIVPTIGLGADVIVTLPVPLVPGIGLRYEKMGLSASSNGVEFDAEYTRTAILFNWRPIDTILYLGPIFSYGISHSTSLKAVENGTTRADFSADSVTSYSAGLEAGIKLIGFQVGAELGYMDFQWKDAKDKAGNAPIQDINMSGTYTKILVGISI
ncbi:hypothetical protein [Bdellovibrio reynosensis]|uniref:Outer membrane protein beta-barrel domain-containing protein n=1 Tax=Bdellovibrio reynosensis TaxID=2835041 RepID=A0ABY4C8A0_9BACT|nr:hypothetical protein [Bdellovibrio reynosensis]UOF01152.1 hypothetical protein MNR06_15745 [Bdellovibrio reynosensis]